MDHQKIERINELARKKKAVGLSEEELGEQRALHEEYLMCIRASLRARLENIEITD